MVKPKGYTDFQDAFFITLARTTNEKHGAAMLNPS